MPMVGAYKIQTMFWAEVQQALAIICTSCVQAESPTNIPFPWAEMTHLSIEITSNYYNIGGFSQT